jgi:hypothetical protein
MSLAASSPSMARNPPPHPYRRSEAAGDEWEYVATDIYGKKQKLIERVKAIVPGAGRARGIRPWRPPAGRMGLRQQAAAGRHSNSIR